MVVRSLAGGLFLGRKADELDRLAGLVARHRGVPVAQERAGHDIGEHGHGAERLCDLEGPRQPVRADVVRFQADDLAADTPMTEPESGRWKPVMR